MFVVLLMFSPQTSPHFHHASGRTQGFHKCFSGQKCSVATSRSASRAIKGKGSFRWSGFHGKFAHLEVTFPVENVYLRKKAREGPHRVSNDWIHQVHHFIFQVLLRWHAQQQGGILFVKAFDFWRCNLPSTVEPWQPTSNLPNSLQNPTEPHLCRRSGPAPAHRGTSQKSCLWTETLTSETPGQPSDILETITSKAITSDTITFGTFTTSETFQENLNLHRLRRLDFFRKPPPLQLAIHSGPRPSPELCNTSKTSGTFRTRNPMCESFLNRPRPLRNL